MPNSQKQPEIQFSQVPPPFQAAQPIRKSPMQATVYLENQEYIALCDLLKLAGLAESGGQAKALIAAGQVQRNGATETRKTAKIRAGEIITLHGNELEIQAGYAPEAA